MSNSPTTTTTTTAVHDASASTADTKGPSSKLNADEPRLKTVVIIGAGGAGIPTFNYLSDVVDPSTTRLVIITPKPYFTHLPAALRMIVLKEEEGYADKVLIPLTKRFDEGNNELVYGKVKSIEDSSTSEEKGEKAKGGNKRQITLEDGKIIEYDYLVLTPGSLWEGALAFPDNKADTLVMLKEWRDRIEAATNVVLVGGGGIGFEFAGEILDEWPDKKVTLVHGQSSLLNNVYPDRWRNDVNQSLLKRGITLVLGDRLDELQPNAEGKVTTRSGRVLDADLVIGTRGPRPNTQFIASSLGADTLTSSGHVKVRPTLQLVDYPHIFAAGDVLDWKEQKSARKAFKHARTITNNVSTLLKGGEKLGNYPGTVEILPLTNGKNGGTSYIGILWGITFGDWMTRLMASKNLYMPRVRQLMRLDE